MDPNFRVVSRLPLDELWRLDGLTTTARGRWLAEDDIRSLLKLGPVQFVVADLGSPLSWVQLKDCYKFWKEEVKPHLAPPGWRIFEKVKNPLVPPDSSIFLDDYPGDYCYFASEWNKSEIVLLEMYH